MKSLFSFRGIGYNSLADGLRCGLLGTISGTLTNPSAGCCAQDLRLRFRNVTAAGITSVGHGGCDPFQHLTAIWYYRVVPILHSRANPFLRYTQTLELVVEDEERQCIRPNAHCHCCYDRMKDLKTITTSALARQAFEGNIAGVVSTTSMKPRLLLIVPG
jgi:hypothetical protein